MKPSIFLKMQLSLSERMELRTKRKYFRGLSMEETRDKLEEMGLRRDISIEAKTTEIAIVTPDGVLMQVRSDENNMLSLWGGIVRDDEEPADAAVRRLFEETGIKISKSDLVLNKEYGHSYTYENGDRCYYFTYQYYVFFDHVPEISQTDETTVEAMLIKHTITPHQHEFVQSLLSEIAEL